MASKLREARTKSTGSKLRQARKGVSSTSQKAEAPKLEYPYNQVANYKTKFKSVGVDTTKALDDRNFIEKGLNLKQDQGVFRDLLEVIDRPRNAFASMLIDTDKKDNVFEDAWKGLSGKVDISGKDIVGKITGKKSEDVGFWAGLGTEIALDPLNFVLPFGMVDDGIKGAKLGLKATSVDTALMGGVKALAKPVVKGTGSIIKAGAKKVLNADTIESLAKIGNQATRAMDSTKGVPKNLYRKVKEMTGGMGFKQKELSSKLVNLQKKYSPETAEQIARYIASEQTDTFKASDIVSKMLRNGQYGKEGMEFLLEDMPTKDVNSLVKHLNDQFSVKGNTDGIVDVGLKQGGDKPFRIEKVAKGTGFKIVLDDKELVTDIQDALKLARETGESIPKTAMIDGVEVPQWDKASLLNRSIQVPRKALDFPVTDEIVKGADELKGIQAEVRKLMTDNDIKVGNKAGYIHKSLDPEAKIDGVMRKETGFQGSPSTFKESMYEMSPWGVNKALGQQLFKENVFEIMQDSINKTTNQVEKLSILREAISTPDGELINYVDGLNVKAVADINALEAQGKVVIKNIDDFKTKFNFIKNSSDLPEIFGENIKKGQALVMDKHVSDLLTFDKAKKSSISEIAKWHDKLMGFWKGSKLLSMGYHMRNYVGASTNMHLAGIPVQDVIKYQVKGFQDYGIFQNTIMKKVAEGTKLSTKEAKLYDEILDFVKDGMVSDSKVRNEMKEIVTDASGKIKDAKGIQKIMQMNYHAGQFVDDGNRFATWRWAKQNFSKVGLESADDAGDFVRYCLFDYADLTDIENTLLRRLFPFYTFAKKNTAFQLKNMMKNQKEYANLNRLVNRGQEEFGLNDENTPDYAEDGMWIPLYKGKDGNVKMLKVSLPQSEAFSILEHPLQTLVNSSSPVVKMPYELISNQRMFTGQPIEKFEGEELTDNRVIKDPKTGYAVDEALGGVTDKGTYALDLLEQIIGKPIGRAEMPSNFRAIPSAVANVNPATTELSNTYDELNDLEALYKKYRQDTGKTLPTVAELRESEEGSSPKRSGGGIREARKAKEKSYKKSTGG